MNAYVNVDAYVNSLVAEMLPRFGPNDCSGPPLVDRCRLYDMSNGRLGRLIHFAMTS